MIVLRHSLLFSSEPSPETPTSIQSQQAGSMDTMTKFLFLAMRGRMAYFRHGRHHFPKLLRDIFEGGGGVSLRRESAGNVWGMVAHPLDGFPGFSHEAAGGRVCVRVGVLCVCIRGRSTGEAARQQPQQQQTPLHPTQPANSGQYAARAMVAD